MTKNVRRKILTEVLIQMERNTGDFHVADIARNLHTSKRTIYENFSSKRNAMQEAMVFAMDDLYNRHKQLLLDENLTPEKKLILYFSISSHTDKVVFMRETDQFYSKMPELYQLVQEKSQRDWNQFEQFVEKTQKSNAFIQFDEQILLKMLRSILADVFAGVNSLDQGYTFSTYMETCISIILYGIKKDGGQLQNEKNG